MISCRPVDAWSGRGVAWRSRLADARSKCATRRRMRRFLGERKSARDSRADVALSLDAQRCDSAVTSAHQKTGYAHYAQHAILPWNRAYLTVGSGFAVFFR